MVELTKRQQQIVDFIDRHREGSGLSPTFREIAQHFGFRSASTVTDHLRLIRQKGCLANVRPKQARALSVVSPLRVLRRRVVDIAIYGAIPAGFANDCKQEVKGCVSIDIGTLGIKPTQRTFALEIRGDSMIGRCIMDGDVVVLEHGMTPRNGDVVAALIDGESTLKTFVVERNSMFLRAENPRYPNLIPASELVIQGVMVALIRKRK